MMFETSHFFKFNEVSELQNANIISIIRTFDILNLDTSKKARLRHARNMPDINWALEVSHALKSKLVSDSHSMNMLVKIIQVLVFRFSMPVMLVSLRHPANQKEVAVGEAFPMNAFSSVAVVTLGE